MKVGELIKHARTERGYSQARLGEMVGHSQTGISSWEKGRTEPSREDVTRIALALDLPATALEPASVEIERPRPILKSGTIPVFSWVNAGALVEPGDDAPAVEELIEVGDLGPGDWFATRVSGTSMDRVAPEDAMIVVNKQDTVLLPGKAYLFRVGAETTFKFWFSDPDRLEPHSTVAGHKTIYPKRNVKWRVIGRVRRSIYDL